MTTSFYSISGQFRYLERETDFDSAIVNGTEGADLIIVNDAYAIISGLGGNDVIYQGPGPKGYVTGGAGNDTIYGAASGGGSVYGNSGNDYLYSRSGATYLIGESGNDTFFGSAGNDLFIGSYIAEGVGFDGFDVVDYGGITSDVVVDLTIPVLDLLNVSERYVGTATGATIGTDYLFAISSVRLGYGNDRLLGSYVNETFQGGAGNDVVAAAGGFDTVEGGEGTDNLSGGDGNDWLTGGNGNDTIYGDAGDDTSYGGAGSDTLYGNDGQDLLYGDAEADTLFGGDGLDTLRGGDGNDVLDGGSGSDSLLGGRGDDIYDVTDSAPDQITELAGQGYDTIRIKFSTNTSYHLAANIEAGTISGPGSGPLLYGNTLDNLLTGNIEANWLDGDYGNDTIFGDAGDDTLNGWEGNDVLNGGAGYDRLYGSAGSDTFVLDRTWSAVLGGAFQVYDAVFEEANGGIDTVEVKKDISDFGTEETFYYTSYTLGSNIENGRVIGVEAFDLSGNVLANTLLGNAAANALSGGDGSDTLGGGAGSDILDGGADNDRLDGGADLDILRGGAGNDTYVLADTLPLTPFSSDYVVDTVTELVNEGVDTVLISSDLPGGYDPDSGVPYKLSFYMLGANVERGVIAGSDTFLLFGNALNNVLTGNVADNTLSGDSGNDTLLGDAGIDSLLGGVGNDRLDGGAGLDALQGGAGNDTYVLASTAPSTPTSSVYAFDTVAELASEGIDTVLVASGLMGGYDPSSGDFYKVTSYTLEANIENGEVTGATGMNLVGNNGANRLQGNAKANTLSGSAGDDILLGAEGVDRLWGGDGNDVLIGGMGADRLSGNSGFDALRYLLASEGGDLVPGFVSGQDYLEVSRAGFGGGLSGTLLAANQFISNTTGLASRSNGQFIFETDTNILWWDADGTGAGARANIATLSGGASLRAADIHLIG